MYFLMVLPHRETFLENNINSTMLWSHQATFVVKLWVLFAAGHGSATPQAQSRVAVNYCSHGKIRRYRFVGRITSDK